jgi:hypothetical protein
MRASAITNQEQARHALIERSTTGSGRATIGPAEGRPAGAMTPEEGLPAGSNSFNRAKQ